MSRVPSERASVDFRGGVPRVGPSGIPERFAATVRSYEAVPYHRELGIVVRGISTEVATVVLRLTKQLADEAQGGHASAGAVYTLADCAMGLSVLSTLPRLSHIATLDLRLDLLGVADLSTELICVAACNHVAPQVAFARCTMYQQLTREADRIIVATGIGVFSRGRRPVRSSRPDLLR
jgi:acyl-coenzyme A thioesterase PaaI-like protein